jgi:hypothetical protein
MALLAFTHAARRLALKYFVNEVLADGPVQLMLPMY